MVKDTMCSSSNRSYTEISDDESEIIHEIVCKASDVPEGTQKMVDVRERKILIVNDEGEYHAVNGLCPHFNLSLENGVYSEGKIRCSYHGACFDVKTGDIEDFPAFDNLHSFDVRREGSDLVLRTTAKCLESDRRARKHKLGTSQIQKKPIIVVGGGTAGQSVVENLRLAGCQRRIIMLTMEVQPPYDRVYASKFYSPDLPPLRTNEWYNENDIEVRCNSEVISLDAERHSITLADSTTMQYSKLVLAPGVRARRFPGRGGNLKGVHNLTNVVDMKAVRAESEGKKLVCIGGSFIGMESAGGLNGLASSVTLICSSNEPLIAYGEDIGRAYRKRWESNGVSVYRNTSVEFIEGDEQGTVKEVVLRCGERIPAQVVVVGIGCAPDTEWLRDEGMEMDERGFVLVNERFETSIEDIYAIGDVVSAPLPFWGFKTLNIQHFQTAQHHGHMAAFAIEGKPKPYKSIPFFWTYGMDKGARMAGYNEGYDDVHVYGNVEKFEWVKYYFRNGMVVAVSTTGAVTPPTAIQFLTLCHQGIRITKEEVLRNPSNDWSSLLNK